MCIRDSLYILKAFDLVDYLLLLQKLESSGIRGVVKDFLPEVGSKECELTISRRVVITVQSHMVLLKKHQHTEKIH